MDLDIARPTLQEPAPTVVRSGAASHSLCRVRFSGALDHRAVVGALETITTALRNSGYGVSILFDDVRIEEVTCLERIASHLTHLRAAGHEIRLRVTEPDLRARLAAFPASYDWLVDDSADAASVRARLPHVDATDRLADRRPTFEDAARGM